MKLIVAAMEEEVKAIVDHMDQVRSSAATPACGCMKACWKERRAPS